jgi:uncharacterized protein (TIGR00369 family)
MAGPELESPVQSPQRTRTVSWEDPMIGASIASSMTGFEYMQALLDGTVPPPPIGNLLQFRPVAAEIGVVTFTCDPDESVYNPIGTVHGGLVCALLDSVLGCAVQTTLPRGQAYTSLAITVNYLRPVTADTGQLTAVGRVTRPGSRAAFAEGTVTDATGKLIATASGSLLIFPVA